MNNVIRLLIALLLVQQVIKTSENLVEEPFFYTIGQNTYKVTDLGHRLYRFNLVQNSNVSAYFADYIIYEGYSLRDLLNGENFVPNLSHSLLAAKARLKHQELIGKNSYEANKNINYNKISPLILQVFARSQEEEQVLWHQLIQLPTYDADAEEKKLLLINNPMLRQLYQ